MACLTCGKLLIKGQTKYCSRTCVHCSFSGSGNPMFKGRKMNAICKSCDSEFSFYQSVSLGKYCSKKCEFKDPDTRERLSAQNIGKHMSEVNKLKMSQLHKGTKKTDITKKKLSISLKKYWDAHGRISPHYALIRSSRKYSEWRVSVFKRDSFSCVSCGDNRGGNLEADHIIPFSFLIEECSIIGNYEPIFDVSNGRTLCRDCHKKTATYLVRKKLTIEHRMLAAIKTNWQQHGKQGDFQVFYRSKIETWIDQIKDHLE